MIANVSRIKGLAQCRQKEHNREIRKLAPLREPEPLMTGESYHGGSANLFATGDVEGSIALAENIYRKRLEGQIILEAEKPLIEREITIVKTALRKYAEHYPREDFTVLMPEVNFMVPLKGTRHHCWYAHRILHPDIPYTPFHHDNDEGCWIEHHFKGRADALLNWRSMVWIFEQKTSGLYTDNWWRQWMLDIQLTGYTYGVWKATGIRPQGVLLNKIRKPRKNESLETWVTSSDLFSREAFMRSDQDLMRFERQFIMQCDMYEDAMANNKIWMNTDACFDWNRVCYYHELCMNHNEAHAGQFATRKDDYVEEAYYDLLKIERSKDARESSSPVEWRNGQ